jgi:hypothetical protein
MDNYRLYFMTADSHHISRFEPIKAASDSLAIEAAALFQGCSPLQLYYRERRVHCFAASKVRKANYLEPDA